MNFIAAGGFGGGFWWITESEVTRPGARGRLTCFSIHAGQNHRVSPAGTSSASIGGSRHQRW